MVSILNQTSYLVNLNLAQLRSVASSTMRKNRTVPISIRLAPGASVDIAPYLGVSLEEARAVVLASDEVKQGCLKGSLVVIDGSEVVEGKLHKVDYIDYPPIVFASQPEETKRNERIIENTAKMIEEKSTEEADLAREAGVTTSVDISDSMPSARWSRERLLQYAEDRGIKIPENMSRNAILKKLRS